MIVIQFFTDQNDMVIEISLYLTLLQCFGGAIYMVEFHGPTEILDRSILRSKGNFFFLYILFWIWQAISSAWVL